MRKFSAMTVYFKRVFPTIWFVGCILLSLDVSAANEPCKEIDGEFLFFGEWVSLSEHSTDGPVKLSIRNSQPRPTLSRQASLHIPNLEAATPVSLRITFDEKKQKIELLEDKQNDKASVSAGGKSNEPDLEFKCMDLKWQRESNQVHRTAESGRQYTRSAVSLYLDQEGNLLAVGNFQLESGFWTKTVYTISSVAKFANVSKKVK